MAAPGWRISHLRSESPPANSQPGATGGADVFGRLDLHQPQHPRSQISIRDHRPTVIGQSMFQARQGRDGKKKPILNVSCLVQTNNF